MKFFIENKTLMFEHEEKIYTLPQEDIQRLASRAGTRVIRIFDKEGKIKPLPVATPIGEIEGFTLLATLL